MAHKCNKEVEITQMSDNIKFIKNRLVGNGEKGLFRKFQELSDDVSTLKNYNHIKNWVLGGAITILSSIIGLLVGLKL